MTKILSLTAKIYLLKTDEGGREGWIISGYRPHVSFDHEKLTDCDIQFSDRQRLYPGDKSEVVLRLVNPEYVKSYLEPGQTFTLNEGNKIVARGEIIKVR